MEIDVLVERPTTSTRNTTGGEDSYANIRLAVRVVILCICIAMLPDECKSSAEAASGRKSLSQT
jgi:hypothetical protein